MAKRAVHTYANTCWADGEKKAFQPACIHENGEELLPAEIFEKLFRVSVSQKASGIFVGNELVFPAGRAILIADGTEHAVHSGPQARQKGYVNNVIPYQSADVFPIWYLKMTEDELYVIENKLSEIQSYYKQMEAKFIMGKADIETEWDAYVAEVERMGIEDVLAAYQAAYDRWNFAIDAVIK